MAEKGAGVKSPGAQTNAGPRETILAEFDEREHELQRFQSRIERLLEDILKAEKVSFHKIESRVKSKGHLAEKLGRLGPGVTRLYDVHDVIGARVITFFSDDVDKVVEVLRREFDVDERMTTDRRASIAPDRFGYLSVHIICHLSAGRRDAPEWRNYREVPIEIQVRSILQHAWAEIEHDLGYKDKQGIRRDVVPPEIVRPFSILAGLFELADQELVRIRDSQSSYATQVSVKLATEAPAAADEPMNALSLLAFIESGNPILAHVDGLVANRAGVSMAPPEKNPLSQRHDVDRLRSLNIETLGQLQDSIATNREKMIRMAREWPWLRADEIPAGFSLFFLILLLAGKGSSVPEVENNLRQKSGVMLSGETLATAAKVVFDIAHNP